MLHEMLNVSTSIAFLCALVKLTIQFHHLLQSTCTTLASCGKQHFLTIASNL